MNYELWVKYNNSIFNQKYFIQTDGIIQGLHMSCSYSDIPSEQFDKSLRINPPENILYYYIIIIFVIFETIFFGMASFCRRH